MQIQIAIYGQVNKQLSGNDQPFDLQIPAGSSVAFILDELGLKDTEEYIVLINGRPATRQSVPNDGDLMVVLPAIEGG